jgi:N-terminal domain of toast_rack, DUF2154
MVASEQEIHMTNTTSSSSSGSRPSGSMTGKRGLMRGIQILSWIVTFFFIIALIGAIYQAIVNGNPLPLWAWLGLLALFAVAVGLIVMAVVYRGVTREVGPFNFQPTAKVTGDLKTETRRVEAGGAGTLQATFQMAEGILRLAGGAKDALEADFTYDDADWNPPQVDYAVGDGGRGNLQVEQKGTGRPVMRQGRCEWTLRLNQDLPTDLKLKFGAGKADLKLGDLTLTGLQVESGVGELVLDLGGEWKRSLEASIRAGIGDTTLRLPREAGVRLQSSVGFGSVHLHGLTRDGDVYTNDLYGQTPVNLDITLQGGIGKINLEMAD